MDYPYVADCIRQEIIKKLLYNGVLIESTDGVYIDATAEIGRGARISHNVTVTGKSVIKNGAVLKPYTVIEDSEVGAFAEVGPFAHLRPNSRLGERVKIGNFMEIKNASLGAGTKAAHLSYIGDADLGEKCNVGCGAVFVNYDGSKKHRTRVGNKCFVGSNVNVVAPVVMSDGSYVAAGSTLTRDLNGGDLCIARERERVLPERAKKYYNPD
ncbi:MAG: UDP-N-acetylglucosamine diphosphorylase [Clostridia bacterium]|nr:UDP-N-acetylglucosamine diphosphorylase [Clostridia bacterium]